MLRPRIAPCLLVKNGGLVKTVKFASPKYVGDPLNAVKIFNEKEVDELVVLDIDASAQRREPDYGLIRNMATECRMPLCYGGGITTVGQVERIIGLGAEKVAVGAAAVAAPQFLADACRVVGGQSIVVVMDVRKNAKTGRYQLWTLNGTVASEEEPAGFAQRMQGLGVGEIVVNSIDCDGVMKGYDLALARLVRSATTLPLSILGGAGSLNDIAGLVREFDVIGAMAGSLFVFKGTYRAVLINYPSQAEKDRLIAEARRPS